MELQFDNAKLMSDEQIVELYWQRDEQAIKQTERKYKRFLLAIAENILFDPSDSEECLNDTYIGAWNAIPPSRPNFLKAFLATIMRRTAIDRYKADSRQKRVASSLTVSLSDLEEFIIDDQSELAVDDTDGLARLINDFIRTLSERRMYIFMSRYYFARPIDEIARLLGCSRSTVDKEIAAIKRELLEKLKKEGYSL